MGLTGSSPWGIHPPDPRDPDADKPAPPPDMSKDKDVPDSVKNPDTGKK